MTSDDEMILVVGGVQVSPTTPEVSRFVRAVEISLLSWRRAKPDDVDAEGQIMGWWGDDVTGDEVGLEKDKIGSRLWLLRRQAVTQSVMNRARDYINEALQWLLDDKVCSLIAVNVKRYGQSGITASMQYTSEKYGSGELKINDLWRWYGARTTST